MRGNPPDGIEPAALFRRLCQAPRAQIEIDFRFNFIDDLQLYVRALTALEFADALNAGPSALIAASLFTADGPAFSCAQEADLLTELEEAEALTAVLDGLGECSPMYSTCDTLNWSSVLKKGADHGSNVSLTHSLGGCVDAGFERYVERPDRFFGVPLMCITDGQWMAYRAARNVYEKRART